MVALTLRLWLFGIGEIIYSYIAVTLYQRFGTRALIRLCAVSTLGVIAMATSDWLHEPSLLHQAVLTPAVDWLGHFLCFAVVILVPILFITVIVVRLARAGTSPFRQWLATAGIGILLGILGGGIMVVIMAALFGDVL